MLISPRIKCLKGPFHRQYSVKQGQLRPHRPHNLRSRATACCRLPSPESNYIPRRLTLSQGLYPSIIIVLVALQKTHCDRNFTHGLNSGPSVQFAAVSNRSAGLSTGRLEEGHIRGATPDYRLEQTRPDYHRRDLSGDVEDSGVYFSSLIKAKEDDFSSPTFADDSMKHGGLMESDVETPRYAL